MVTWWHLIKSLLPHSTASNRNKAFQEVRQNNFKDHPFIVFFSIPSFKVVAPFLLFCIGLDPKCLSLIPSLPDDATPEQIFNHFSTSRHKSGGTSFHYYPFAPSVSMISTGCLSILLLLGVEGCDIKEALIVKGMDRWIDGSMDTTNQTDRQINRWMDRWINV